MIKFLVNFGEFWYFNMPAFIKNWKGGMTHESSISGW